MELCHKLPEHTFSSDLSLSLSSLRVSVCICRAVDSDDLAAKME